MREGDQLDAGNDDLVRDPHGCAGEDIVEVDHGSVERCGDGSVGTGLVVDEGDCCCCGCGRALGGGKSAGGSREEGGDGSDGELHGNCWWWLVIIVSAMKVLNRPLEGDDEDAR